MNDQSFTIHDLPNDERPRERLLNYGARSLSTSELLAIILRTGTKQENVLQLAGRILAQCDGLRGLARLSAPELVQIKGLGEAKAAQILAAIELGRRAHLAQPDERAAIRSATDAANLMLDMSHLAQEQVRVMLLDNQQRVVATSTVYIGTVNLSIIRPSEIFREAILRNSPTIILFHNHPSGNPLPSPEDVEMTRILAQAGALLDIELADHIIIAGHDWRSLRLMGLFDG